MNFVKAHKLPPGLADFSQALRLLPLLLHLARTDLLSRYRRTVLGPFWLTLGTAAGTVGLGWVWAELFQIERSQFIPPMTVGLIMWQFLSGCVVEAPVAFARQGMIIRNLSMPLAIHPMQTVIKHVVNLIHNVPVFVLVALVFHLPFNRYTLLAFPLLLLVIANLLWITLALSVLGARYRDLEFLIGSAMPFLMFLSPVFYRPGALSATRDLIWFNPFSHLIELVRYPLLGSAPPHFLLLSNLLFCLIGWVVALSLFNAKCKRIAYWM